MRREGFTLLEVMVSTAILGIVMGMLYVLSLSVAQGVATQDASVTAQDEARNAIMQIVREVRQAASGTVNWAALPGGSVTYRIAEDIDGNGTAVDIGGALELTAPRTLSLDIQDLNGDGLRGNQLILNTGQQIMVLANNVWIEPGSTPPSGGFLVEPWGNGLRFTLITQGFAGPNTTSIRTTLREVVVPRN